MDKIMIKICIACFFIPVLFASEQSSIRSESALDSLKSQIRQDLIKINVPAYKWIKHAEEKEETIDVAIIGGGMAGMTVGFALFKEGIVDIQIFDQNPENEEGTWVKCARMKHLRSNKGMMGPALGIPSLTFRAWYETLYGKPAWRELKDIPTLLWAEYLHWYRQVLKLPVRNGMSLKSIHPKESCLELVFEHEGAIESIFARKVILATGRDGFGGGEIPGIFRKAPKKFYAHTCEKIDPATFNHKDIAVIGCGASAFDAAAVALENQAKSVVMLVRRDSIPTVNKFAQFAFSGMFHGFYGLSDEMRCRFFAEAMECGIPPPKEALERVQGYEEFHVRFNTSVHDIDSSTGRLLLKTNNGDLQVDFVVLGTGYAVDGFQKQELRPLLANIKFWRDQSTCELACKIPPKVGRFPYLGEHFQFQEKIPGCAPYLKNIYCFNYGAFLSHGLISGDIPGISIGAGKLARGIAADFFKEEAEIYLQFLVEYAMPLFDLKEPFPL